MICVWGMSRGEVAALLALLLAVFLRKRPVLVTLYSCFLLKCYDCRALK